jgi:hypothetical protein
VASKTAILNIALSRIGVSKQVANVDTENSLVAQTARTIIDEDIRYVLRDFPWPWATAYATLALVAGSASENAVSDWRYSYRMPADCLFARRIVVPTLGRNNANPPPYRIGRDVQGKLIYTNEEDAELEYTVAVTDAEEFDPMFVSQLAWKLGSGLGPSLSRIKGVSVACMEMYEIDKTKAQSRALNEGQQEVPIEAEGIRARDS